LVSTHDVAIVSYVPIGNKLVKNIIRHWSSTSKFESLPKIGYGNVAIQTWHSMVTHVDVSHVTSHARAHHGRCTWLLRQNYWHSLYNLIFFCSIEKFILFRQILSSMFSLKKISQESKKVFESILNFFNKYSIFKCI